MPILTSATHVLTRRMPKIISPKAHAVVDYITAGAFLLTGAFYWSRNKRAALGARLSGPAVGGQKGRR